MSPIRCFPTTGPVSTRHCTGTRSTTCSPATTRSPAGGCFADLSAILRHAGGTTAFYNSCRTSDQVLRSLNAQQDGDAPELGYLAILTPSGAPAVFLVNRGVDDINLSLDLGGNDVTKFSLLSVWRTDREHKAENVGRLRLRDGSGSLFLPARSLTTLFPVGAVADPSEAAS